MSNSICKFVTAEQAVGNVKPVYFVYETEFHTLRQPFYHAMFSVHLVTGGTAVLKYPTADFTLQTGDVFFSFPSCAYRIDADADFRYMYISFMGNGCQALLDELSVTPASPVYHGFEHLLPFWSEAIRRKQQTNVALLTESVLLYTLSFMQRGRSAEHGSPLFEQVVGYVDTHYRDPDLSLTQLATAFSYTEKYLSHLFVKHMGMPFKKYLNALRLQYAYKLIADGETSVAAIAEACGYTDPWYFTRVFKKKRNITPTQAIKSRDADP